jgi:hypothetical protein
VKREEEKIGEIALLLKKREFSGPGGSTAGRVPESVQIFFRAH